MIESQITVDIDNSKEMEHIIMNENVDYDKNRRGQKVVFTVYSSQKHVIEKLTKIAQNMQTISLWVKIPKNDDIRDFMMEYIKKNDIKILKTKNGFFGGSYYLCEGHENSVIALPYIESMWNHSTKDSE